ncbi:MAG: ArgE/DapE family deacylase [Verrucomicrobiales bacterium]|nr:ArgE/DapE family deacylase [Verrucomicrobiales bacterium]
MNQLNDTLSSLIAINSVNPVWGGPGEAAVAAFIETSLGKAGVEFTTDEVFPGRKNVIAKIPGRTSERAIALEAHMDTVSVGGMTIPPFDPMVKEGRIYGRGSCDTKGGLAAMLETMIYLKEESLVPPCDVYFIAVVDEEHAFSGALRSIEWLREKNIQLESVVVSEPTSLQLVIANKGVLRFQIETLGKAAHSSKPHLGVNAISRIADVIKKVEAFHAGLYSSTHPLLGSATGCISLIEGGDQINFVPERCALSIDHRLLPGESGADVMQAYRDLFAEDSGNVIVHDPDLLDEAMETDSAAEVVRIAVSVLSEMGLPDKPVGVPFGCDVTKFSRAGIDGIIFGPGSIDQAHGAVEYVDLKEVEKAFDFYIRFLMNYEL